MSAPRSSFPARMSVQAERNAEAEYGFPGLFARFAPAAWARFDETSQSLSEWARVESRRFYHDVSQRVPFLRTYQALLRFAEVQQSLEEQREVERQRRQVAEEAVEHLREIESSLDTSGAERWEKQAAEEYKDREVRAWVNRLCWREHGRWWDAFQEEMVDGRRRAWVREAAQVLRKSGGYQQDFAEALTWCWLKESLSRYPDRF